MKFITLLFLLISGCDRGYPLYKCIEGKLYLRTGYRTDKIYTVVVGRKCITVPENQTYKDRYNHD